MSSRGSLYGSSTKSSNLKTGNFRERRLGLSAKSWDKFSWKRVDIPGFDADNHVGSNEMFLGLEELDGDAFVRDLEASKRLNSSTVTSVEDVSSDNDAPEKKKAKKNPKSKKEKTEEDEDAVVDEETIAKREAAKAAKKEKFAAKKAAKKAAIAEKKAAKKAAAAAEESGEDSEEVFGPGSSDEEELVVVETPRLVARPIRSDGDDEAVETLPVPMTKKEKQAAAAKLAKNAKRLDMAELPHLQESVIWADDVAVPRVLRDALLKLDFTTPTPIQRRALPIASRGGTDILGVAETGSGKTLAFVLPVLKSLITNWEEAGTTRTLFALIISPTRELAMQISNVTKELCDAMKSASGLNIAVASVVGGMSEEKQRRLLNTDIRPLHIAVATPGRLSDILTDETIVAFRNLSTLRYLVVDEADRMMEEGHFKELTRLFSRIRDHEDIAAAGKDVEEELRRRAAGIDEDPTEKRLRGADESEESSEEEIEEEVEEMEEDVDSENEVLEFNDDLNDDDILASLDMDIPSMPSEEEISSYRNQLDAVKSSGEDPYEEARRTQKSNKKSTAPKKKATKKGKKKTVVLQRQTLLFSATAVESSSAAALAKKSKHKLRGTLVGVSSNCGIPSHIKELLAQAAIQSTIEVVDVTHDTTGAIVAAAALLKPRVVSASGVIGENNSMGEPQKPLVVALPATLLNYESRIPSEDKDVYMYYYLHKYPGRTLIFCNSIKTVRRVDGLLRALGLFSRAIHADLPQRARLKALDAFKTAPNGILVATDVAARGLDVNMIRSVIHYDIARSPQVYVHRAGRTARAGSEGVSLSLVVPEDTPHHVDICEFLTGKRGANVSALALFKTDLSILPPLRERVRLAKKIFTASFVDSQSTKERSWMSQSAAEAELPFDEQMEEEVNGEEIVSLTNKQKKEIARMRAELAVLLDTPIVPGRPDGKPAMLPGSKSIRSGRSQKVIGASSGPMGADWRKRKTGFFVYATGK